ncbi:unnamed protein product [Adineta ricciae]|uniref:LolA-like domain-containing protein n=1 Tax=Adineta ricciae TaxID=249248 RepID=A0A814HQZ9_ADIRI|nr:unnamed protein product [Adineta ricciae]CAF1172622.1 unnamed protein product [Adineta ricciae]
MSFNLTLLTVCLLVCRFSCQQIDFSICPNGLTNAPSDPQWPSILPNHFELTAELTTDVETIEITQSFLGPYRDVVYFHSYQTTSKTYSDFDTNELLVVFDDPLLCDRLAIGSNDVLPYLTSQIVKPSILLGFTGRNNYNSAFYTRYLGIETVREGIRAKKFQSCFFIEQEQVTINATYYIGDSPPDQSALNVPLDFVQIDVRSNNLPYTYNILRYVSNPSLTIETPSNVYCPNRTNTKPFPQNLPSRLSLHSEIYTLKNNDTPSRVESYNRLIDETLLFERIDYTMDKLPSAFIPSILLFDYSSNLNYLYARESQECIIRNVTSHAMGTTNEILFQFGAMNNTIQFQYTGITHCNRPHLLCHRWIGQQEFGIFKKQYEWYWSAKYNDIDLQELIPIQVYLTTITEAGPSKMIKQETNIFNYNSQPNSMQLIDTTIGECYRALGPSHQFNYAILRMTLNNDAEHPVHQHLLSLENRLHMQLASDLRIRHIRLSSFAIDMTRDTTDQHNKDVYVTFTLLDNPPVSNELLKEPPSLQVIRQLAQQINEGKFYVRDNDGGYDLQARPNSLRTLVLYLLPSENHTSYFNETIFVYHNVTNTIYRQREKIVHRHTGPLIAAFWMGFALLGMIVTLAISSFVAVRKWTPTINNHNT